MSPQALTDALRAEAATMLDAGHCPAFVWIHLGRIGRDALAAATSDPAERSACERHLGTLLGHLVRRLGLQRGGAAPGIG